MSRSRMNNQRLRKEKKLFELHHETIISGEILEMLNFLKSYIMFNDTEKCLIRRIEYDGGVTLEENYMLKLSNQKYYHLIDTFFDRCIEQHTYYRNRGKYIAEAIAYRGIVFEKGLFGHRINLRKAFEYFSTSSELFSPFGMFKLAQYYEKGKIIEKDIFRALHLYKCAAKLGIVDSLHTYGTILLQNNFQDEFSHEIGLYYIKMAVKKSCQEYPYACYDYGRYLEHNLTRFSTKNDISYCLKIYHRGAKFDCPNCSYRLALAYEKGELGCCKSLEEALKWYRQAAYKGNYQSFFILSMYYFKFSSIDNAFNKEKAFYYCLSSAIGENLEAIKYISMFYWRGIGVKKSKRLSIWWDMIYHELCIVQRKRPEPLIEVECDSLSSSEETDVSCESIPPIFVAESMIRAL